jgi:arylsulfatase
VRWPDKIKAGSISNGIVQHHDWLPTFLAMAGDVEVVQKGYKAIGRTYKNHIDGFNLLPYLTGEGSMVDCASFHLSGILILPKKAEIL